MRVWACRDAATADRMRRGARVSTARMDEEEEGNGKRESWFTAITVLPLSCCSLPLSNLSTAQSKSDWAVKRLCCPSHHVPLPVPLVLRVRTPPSLFGTPSCGPLRSTTSSDCTV